MTTTNNNASPTRTRKKLTPQQRLARYALRYLKLGERGKAAYTKRRDVLTRMISAGLMVDKPIEIAGLGNFVLVDNFNGDKTGGWATVPRFELKPLSEKKAKEFAAAKEEAVGA